MNSYRSYRVVVLVKPFNSIPYYVILVRCRVALVFASRTGIGTAQQQAYPSLSHLIGPAGVSGPRVLNFVDTCSLKLGGSPRFH